MPPFRWRNTNRSTGIASSTSFASTMPRIGASGQRSNHSTRPASVGRQLREPRALALGEIRADFEDPVAAGQRPECLELEQHVGRHAARARAELEHVAAGLAQHVGRLPREAAREQAGHFRRRHEITTRADLGRARAVVAEARCIQRQPHVGIEPDRAAALANEFADVSRHALASERAPRV